MFSLAAETSSCITSDPSPGSAVRVLVVEINDWISAMLDGAWSNPVDELLTGLQVLSDYS